MDDGKSAIFYYNFGIYGFKRKNNIKFQLATFKNLTVDIHDDFLSSVKLTLYVLLFPSYVLLTLTSYESTFIEYYVHDVYQFFYLTPTLE